jgi:hypothetical protein
VYHRPCYFLKTITGNKGKDKKIYPYGCMMTPYEKLKSIDNAKNCLKDDKKFDLIS